MAVVIEQRLDRERGCGYRKPGGMYLVSGKPNASCSKLPHELHVCPTCNQGVKPFRDFGWVDASKLIPGPCEPWCLLNNPPEKAGLIWVGSKFYPTPADFLKEAREQGISRRIKTLSKDVKLGETLILLAHREATRRLDENDQWQPVPGIFSAFIPSAIEYVVKGDEDDEKLERLVKRGITPVKVVTDQPQQLALATTRWEDDHGQ